MKDRILVLKTIVYTHSFLFILLHFFRKKNIYYSFIHSMHMEVGSQLVGVCSLSRLRVREVGLVSSGLAAGPSSCRPSFVSSRQSHYI